VSSSGFEDEVVAKTVVDAAFKLDYGEMVWWNFILIIKE